MPAGSAICTAVSFTSRGQSTRPGRASSVPPRSARHEVRIYCPWRRENRGLPAHFSLPLGSVPVSLFVVTRTTLQLRARVAPFIATRACIYYSIPLGAAVYSFRALVTRKIAARVLHAAVAHPFPFSPFHAPVIHPQRRICVVVGFTLRRAPSSYWMLSLPLGLKAVRL